MPTVHSPKLDAAEFAARLREALSDNAIPIKRGTGAMLARKYNSSIVTANAWLKGTHRADTERARQMASELGVEFEWLYFGKLPKRHTGTPHSKATRTEREPSPLELEILELYRRSPPEFQELATLILKASTKLTDLVESNALDGLEDLSAAALERITAKARAKIRAQGH